ncbi:MAG: preprotein translocase subunit SecE [Peptoclostridium sp.]|uniref:preprotein translocase subunit SecE n=1 Tax=Peptoclostridium sp. TaxID=1904860 RepID=UPI00139C7820|nr:preprotein translocase subunit SecE [Peptoclostridium sp.]MZQ74887.1 preprotein translocase subunit SecE [Peptoclostridium sp.]
MAAQVKAGNNESGAGFLKEVRAELSRVHWPNKRELTRYTTIVLLVSTFISLVVWLLDSGLGFLLKFIVKQ